MRQRNTTMGAVNVAGFRRQLLRWYGKHQRKLPWRGESDPYRILVSEIMLQQTRVAVVEDRYKKFIAQFPTVEKLARAKEATVLAAWSGLGYYRRARNLHAAAREIAKAAAFPQTPETLRELPGIGDYTANAVASIAFGQPVPVVDGNVKRVLTRFTGRALNDGEYWRTAEALLDRSCPGDFNQGLMELGATVCLPGKPLCETCPVIELCASRGAEVKRERAARKKAVLKYALCIRDGRVLLRQRPDDSSLMPGMWELPTLVLRGNGSARAVLRLRHSITTTDYTVFVHATGDDGLHGRWVSLSAAKRLALTGLARKVLERIAHA
ncbi:MAG TPA: A/G-specific adenine glycosylase [Candidatus Angelobacter sp.]|nr:A/G-specific adenine glycosylase [Candidatus Angelobacter sp.]